MYNNLEELQDKIYSPKFKREDLTEKQLEYFDKLDVADNLLRNEITFNRAKEKFMAKYNLSSITTAKYLREAQILFSSKSRYNKEYYKDVLLDKALAKLDWCFKENKIGEFTKLLKQISTIFGYDRADAGTIDPELLKQHSYNIILNLKGDKTTYNLSIDDIHKMQLPDRMKIVDTIEAEAIQFEMRDIIKNINFEDED